jgi:hypothetical protein
MRINKRWVAPLVVVGALATGGAAYTNGIGFLSVASQESTIGYGKLTVTGTTVTDVQYTVSPGGQNIDSETITFGGNLPQGQLVYAQWNDDGDNAQMVVCTDGNVADGTFTSNASDPGPFDGAQCTIVTPVDTADNFDVSVVPPGNAPGTGS